MRTKDKDLLSNIIEFIEDYCDSNGYGPSVRDIAAELEMSSTNAHRYLTELINKGKIKKGKHGYETKAFAKTERAMRSIAVLGAVPCGELTEIEEYVEGYVRLPESFVGQGKFYILRASGRSMIGAGIEDGDWVLIRQQNTANIGDIVVALVENEVTLKRLAFDADEKQYYLHPENKRMKDIYVDEIQVQGIAVKVIKNL